MDGPLAAGTGVVDGAYGSTASAGIDSDSANASTNSVAVAKRSPGDLANPDWNTAFTRSGASQVPGGTAGMGSVTCWVATAIGVGARYGGLPVRHSNTKHIGRFRRPPQRR